MSDPRPPWEQYAAPAATDDSPPWEQAAAQQDTRPPWEQYATPTPQAPEQQFPTTAESMGTMAQGAGSALWDMAKSIPQAAAAPFMAVPREVAAMAGYGESPSMAQLRASGQHITNALKAGPMGAEGAGEAISAIPMVGPAVVGAIKGAGTILTPAYKSATGRTGEITPEEMKQAASVGGAGVANLGTALVAPKVPGATEAVAAKVTPANVVNVLKFTAKNVGPEALAEGLGAHVGVGYLGGQVVRAILRHPKVMALGDIAVDKMLRAAQNGNLGAAAQAAAKALERHPEIAETVAKDVATMPPPQPKVPTGTPIVGRMPTPGNVKMATVYTKPKTIDAPFTPSQRKIALEDLQRQIATDDDIFAAFGISGDK